MIYVVVIEESHAGEGEAFASRHEDDEEAASLDRDRTVRLYPRHSVVTRTFDEWCPDCKGRGWHVGECHPQEVCGTCGGNGAVREKKI